MPLAPDCPASRWMRRPARSAVAGAVMMLALGVAAGTTPAQAQSPAKKAPPAAAPQTQAAGDPVEAQLAEIRTRLGITAAQQPHFENFANVLKQNAQAMEAMIQKAMPQARPNAVEGLRIAASFAQTEADNLKRLVPALEALYASLSEQQKRTADEMFGTAPSSDTPPSGQPPARPRG